MKKLLAWIILLVTIGVLWWHTIGGHLPKLAELDEVVQKTTEILTPAKNVMAPPPLRATQETPSAYLTSQGILRFTNAARRDNGGLKPLALNAKLNDAAQNKLKDMLAKQYFGHISPTGVGPGELATQAKYEYISVGENLAMGNFKNDQTLIEAWMASPGHRANILNKGFLEIGIGVGRGMFQGKTTWLAVQEFGRPQSACTQVDANLKSKINDDEAQLKSLANTAKNLKDDLDSTPKPRTREEVETYNTKVDAYNSIAKQINYLIQQIQGETTVYNGQIEALNACAKS